MKGAIFSFISMAVFVNIRYCLLMVLFFNPGMALDATEIVPKVAIIGGGIGGTGAAYFLKDLFGEDGINIHLYNIGDIGGRLSTVVLKTNGLGYEMGGSVIHPKNHYVVRLMKELDLKRRKMPHDSPFGFFDGEKFTFRDFYKGSIIDKIRLLWRYGLSVFKMEDHVRDLVDKFSRIYDLQNTGFSYPTINDMLAGIDTTLPDYLHISLKEALKRDGFPQLLTEELISAALACNYGQTTDVHKFVGFVALAGASGGLFSIKGGNHRLPEELLLASGASLKKALVTGIELIDKQRYLLHTKNNNTEEYDAIIMAFPYAKNINSKFEFKNFPQEFIFEPVGYYHYTVSTIVKGTLNYTYFGFKNEKDVVDQILCVRTDLAFNSVSRIYSVDGMTREKSDVWKIFSQMPLPKDLIKSMFTEVEETIAKYWLAYPHYKVDWRYDKFNLFDNLYHINSIEWAASAMEMSLVGAKNVALSLFHDWSDRIGRSPKQHIKEEL